MQEPTMNSPPLPYDPYHQPYHNPYPQQYPPPPRNVHQQPPQPYLQPCHYFYQPYQVPHQYVYQQPPQPYMPPYQNSYPQTYPQPPHYVYYQHLPLRSYILEEHRTNFLFLEQLPYESTFEYFERFKHMSGKYVFCGLPEYVPVIQFVDAMRPRERFLLEYMAGKLILDCSLSEVWNLLERRAKQTKPHMEDYSDPTDEERMWQLGQSIQKLQQDSSEIVEKLSWISKEVRELKSGKRPNAEISESNTDAECIKVWTSKEFSEIPLPSEPENHETSVLGSKIATSSCRKMIFSIAGFQAS